MTIFAAIGGALASFWFLVVGALLRWILRSNGHQLFHGAFVIGDIALWIALAIIVVSTFFGFLMDVVFVSSATSGRKRTRARRR